MAHRVESSALSSAPASEEALIPWNHYPRPLEIRHDSTGASVWQTLNGPWHFGMSRDRADLQRDPRDATYTHTIIVPYPMEAPLSGVRIVDDIPVVDYHRSFVPPDAWAGKRVFAVIDSADYESTMYINDEQDPVVTHRGGYTPFKGELTDAIKIGEVNDLYLHVVDDLQNQLQPRGKQSKKLHPHSCFYWPKTGISDASWLQVVPQTFIEKRYYTPRFSGQNVDMRIGINGDHDSLRLNTKVYTADGKEVGSTDMLAGNSMEFAMKLSEVIPWEPRDDGEPHRYTVEHNLYRRYEKGVIDRVESKFGMREVRTEGNRILLNDRPFMLRGTLYQRYFTDSLYLPPDLETTQRQADRIKASGYNSIRAHQNVLSELEAEEFAKRGIVYTVEIANWTGEWIDEPKAKATYADAAYIPILAQEAREAMELHYNNPAFVATLFLNETPNSQHEDLVPTMYHVAKDFVGDTRLVGSISGFTWPKDEAKATTDFRTYHFYTQNPEELRQQIQGVLRPDRVTVIDEFGGGQTEPRSGKKAQWLELEQERVNGNVKEDDSLPTDTSSNGEWGYGEPPKTKREALARKAALTQVICESEAAGFVNTQWRSTPPEFNGDEAADGEMIFTEEELYAINAQSAAIEEEEEEAAVAAD